MLYLTTRKTVRSFCYNFIVHHERFKAIITQFLGNRNNRIEFYVPTYILRQNNVVLYYFSIVYTLKT